MTSCHTEADCDGDGKFESYASKESNYTITCKPTHAGIHKISVRGEYVSLSIIAANNATDEIVSLDQWGSAHWQYIGIFPNIKHQIIYNASDNPNLKQVESLAYWSLPYKCFAESIKDWDVSNIKDMDYMLAKDATHNTPDIDKPLDPERIRKVVKPKFWYEDEINRIMPYAMKAMPSIGQPLPPPPWIGENFDKDLLCSAFNQPIGNWNVSSVTTMRGMFEDTDQFNQPLDQWDVGNVTEMSRMFAGTKSFNQSLNNWDTQSLEKANEMFKDNKIYNKPLNNWDTRFLKSAKGMFQNAKSFNQPLNQWDMSSSHDLSYMFAGAEAFNQPLDNWDVKNTRDMSHMFEHAHAFNQPIFRSVRSIENLSYMFSHAYAFNQPIDSWYVTYVEDMSHMFEHAHAFNQPIFQVICSAKDMSYMFSHAYAFNQPMIFKDFYIENMSYMFENAKAFNQPIGNWQISSNTQIYHMLYGADAFDQYIKWYDSNTHSYRESW